MCIVVHATIIIRDSAMSRAFLQDCREIWNALQEHPRQSALLFL
jgi:phosphate uptake regulator